jgi:NADH-quinone oxidoreductase subunit L
MNDLLPVKLAILIPLLPLIGAAIAGFFGAKWLRGKSHWPIWLGVGGSAILSFMLLAGMLGHVAATAVPSGIQVLKGSQLPTAVHNYFTWIHAGKFTVTWGYFFDPLTAVMLCVVCGVGLLIIIFAAGYMKGEQGYWRFFAYLGLFIFAMTTLVMGENLVMLYLGWEGVGLCSYLLIGYYYEKPSAREAAKKAFIVNRVGDFGFALGIMLCFYAFGTISFWGDSFTHGQPGLLTLATIPTNPGHWALKYIPFLLMLGAFGKSAQFPLHVWLPDAMEGPTPVSALIHAATMVTAGVYMIARCATLFIGSTAALATVAVIGAFTALMAATIALRQFDLKKVFAYSTVSQLGYMFVAVGTLAPVAGVFHLVTHAFFKALLFLSSGVVMHAMSGELDMRKMSGLKAVLPKTRWLMLIGCLALAGCPFFSGFFSKDEIVANTWQHSRILGGLMLFTAFLTAYYTFRLYFRVFEGPLVVPAPAHDDAHGHDAPSHDADHSHNHEPFIMIGPLILLAIGALFVGYINWPTERLAEFLGQSPSFYYAGQMAGVTYQGQDVAMQPFGMDLFIEDAQAATLHHQMMIISGVLALAGIALAGMNHLADRARADRLAAALGPITVAIEHKYWIDEFYDAAIVQPLWQIGRIFYFFDRYVIDGLVWLVSFVPQFTGFALKLSVQRGYLQGYAVTMLLGLVAILLLVLMHG